MNTLFFLKRVDIPLTILIPDLLRFPLLTMFVVNLKSKYIGIASNMIFTSKN